MKTSPLRSLVAAVIAMALDPAVNDMSQRIERGEQGGEHIQEDVETTWPEWSRSLLLSLRLCALAAAGVCDTDMEVRR
jgi:hypothetical protein